MITALIRWVRDRITRLRAWADDIDDWTDNREDL